MVTTASKFFFAAAAAAFAGAVAYGIGTDGDLLGVLTVGLKGPVGDLAGYSVLVTLGVVMLGLGTASSILRDADPEVQAAVARLESLPPVVAPTHISYWPVLGALGAVVAAIGLVASPVLFVIGALGVLLVLLEWMVSAWAERATGDPSVNRQIRNRLMYPLEIPVVGALGILVLVVSISRILLTVSRNGSSIVAIVVAAVVLAFGFFVAYRPRLSKDLLAGVLVLAATAVVAGGILGAASGTREFEHHEAETEHETDEPGAGGVEGGEGDETDAGGGPDAGAEDDPPQNDPGNDGAETDQGDQIEEDEPIAEGTDEGQDQGGDSGDEDESGLAPLTSASEG